MEFKVIASSGKDLDVFKENEKIFYSKLNYSWFKKSIQIFNGISEKLIEIKYKGFFTEKFEIVWQSKTLRKQIKSIEKDKILLNNNSKLEKSYGPFFFKNMDNYKYNGKLIATVNEKYWFWKRKITVKIEDMDFELLEVLIIAILTFESGIVAENY